MITVKSGNYSLQEKSIISSVCKVAINHLCDECGHLCRRFGGHFQCPYKYLIYDIYFVDKKFSNLAVTENDEK